MKGIHRNKSTEFKYKIEWETKDKGKFNFFSSAFITNPGISQSQLANQRPTAPTHLKYLAVLVLKKRMNITSLNRMIETEIKIECHVIKHSLFEFCAFTYQDIIKTLVLSRFEN